MRVDLLAIAGIVVGVATIVAGNLLEGGTVAMLLNGPAAVIVLGGTMGAVLLQTPTAQLLRAGTLLRWAFLAPDNDREQVLQKLERCLRAYRARGVLGLDDQLQKEGDEFHRSALELAALEREPAQIRAALELDLRNRMDTDLAAASVYESMGGYAPTIGILGAVIGLIQVMTHLEDPAQLGPGIATAFVATIYGVGFANLLFLPVAERLRKAVEAESELKWLWVEGLLAVLAGEHPATLRLRIGVSKSVGCLAG